jgi:MFS family permease
MTAVGADPASVPIPSRAGFWNRELNQFPRTGQRVVCLGIVILATIVLYYQFYLAGAVATRILADYHMSFVYYVNISVVGYLLGAVASFLTGIADRYGRANIVTVGLFIVGLLCLIGIPNAHSKIGFGVVFAAIGLVEGMILVATPALVRDFSPQLGRASAMGFWTLGPVLGSLVVSVQVSNTSNSKPWQDHYLIAGVVGLVIAALSAVFLRELAPALRDQLMVTSRDRALIEARAKGIDVEASLRRPFRQMLKPDIVGSALAISVFLIIYYVAVGFFPVYFQTIFGFSQSKANALGNWNWTFNALALLVVGFVSDVVRVRKPFMIAGAVGSVVFTILFLSRATHPDTSYGTFVWLLIGLSMCLGIAYAPWMASFTETVERRNPALSATGLAVWGLVIRVVIAVSVFFVPHVVNTVTTLVEKGPGVQAAAAGLDPNLTAAQNAVVKAVAADPTIVTRVQAAASKYAPEIATGQKIDATTKAALAANPSDPTAQVTALSEISGVSAADTGTVVSLNAAHGPALAAAAAIDPATQIGLVAHPTSRSLAAKAIGEIVAKLHISVADATTRLQDLASIPVPQLLIVKADGAKITAAATQLRALSTVPPADLALLQTYGVGLQDPTTQAALKNLVAEGGIVKHAAATSPKQWQHYFWIAVGGEILFIPLIFLMAGFWSSRRAKEAEREHEAWLSAELAKLSEASSAS